MLLIHSVRLIHRGFIIETSVKTYTKGNHNMTTEVDNLLSQLRLAGMRESFSNRNKEAKPQILGKNSKIKEKTQFFGIFRILRCEKNGQKISLQ